MIKMPELNRHMVGIPALLLLIGAVGFMGSQSASKLGNSVERTAQRLDNTMQTAMNRIEQPNANSTAWDSKFLDDLSRSMMEHRSAAAQRPDQAAQPSQNIQGAQQGTQPSQNAQRAENAAQPSSAAVQDARGLAASALKEWSDQDWQVAAKAVEERRSAARSHPTGEDAKASMGETGKAPLGEHRSKDAPLVWQPPAEIGNKSPSR